MSDTLFRLCADVADLADAVDVFLLTDESGDLSVVANTGAELADAEPIVPAVASRTVLPAAEMPGGLVRDGAQWVTIQPLQRASGSFGSIIITHTTRPAWEAEEASGLDGVAEVASLAVAYAAQQQMARDLELLEDRHRIARDLHDHVIQRLFAIGMSVQTMMAAHTAGQRVDRAEADKATSARLEQVVVLLAVVLLCALARQRRRIVEEVTGGHEELDAGDRGGEVE